jgi:hypothetical protein
VLVEDWWMERAATRALLLLSRHGKATLWIPEVVLAELVNKRSERLRAQVGKHADVTRALDGLLPHDQRVPWRADEIDLGADRAEYDRVLRQRLAEAKVNITPWPDVAHEELVVRDLERRRPFSPNGSGYRDALIWETVKAIAQECPDDVLYFVSTNNDDFAAHKSNDLHPDLKREAPNVVLEQRLDAVVNRIDPLRRVLQDLRARIETDSNFRHRIETDMRELVESDSPDETSFYNNPEATSAYLRRLGSIRSLTVAGVLPFDDDRVLVNFEVMANVEADLTGPVPDDYDETWPIEEEAFLAFDGILDAGSGELRDLQWAELGV